MFALSAMKLSHVCKCSEASEIGMAVQIKRILSPARSPEEVHVQLRSFVCSFSLKYICLVGFVVLPSAM